MAFLGHLLRHVRPGSRWTHPAQFFAHLYFRPSQPRGYLASSRVHGAGWASTTLYGDAEPCRGARLGPRGRLVGLPGGVGPPGPTLTVRRRRRVTGHLDQRRPPERPRIWTSWCWGLAVGAVLVSVLVLVGFQPRLAVLRWRWASRRRPSRRSEERRGLASCSRSAWPRCACTLAACGTLVAQLGVQPSTSSVTSRSNVMPKDSEVVRSSPPPPTETACNATASLPPRATMPSHRDQMPAGSYMAQILAHGYLKVGIDPSTYLWGYHNPVTGQLTGFDIDMLPAACRGDLRVVGSEVHPLRHRTRRSPRPAHRDPGKGRHSGGDDHGGAARAREVRRASGHSSTRPVSGSSCPTKWTNHRAAGDGQGGPVSAGQGIDLAPGTLGLVRCSAMPRQHSRAVGGERPRPTLW